MEPVSIKEALETFQAAVKLIQVSLAEIEPKNDEVKYYINGIIRNINTMKVEDIEESLYILCDE